MAQDDESRTHQLYSDDEVANPGYPGAILMLGAALSLFAVATVVLAVVDRDVIGGALCGLGAGGLGVVFILKARRVRRAQRREAWQCPRCFYDRRGLAADAACPECGTVPT